MIPRGVTKLLSIFSSSNDPRSSSIGAYLETHRSELVGESGPWRQSVACKPLVGSMDDLWTWVHNSWDNEETGDTWTTLGGPITLEVLGSLSRSTDVSCRKGVVKALVCMLLTENAFEAKNQYETIRIRRDNINEIYPNLCESYKAEIRSSFMKYLSNEERQLSFEDGPFAQLIWTICPDELLRPTLALVGEVRFSVAFGAFVVSELSKAVSRNSHDMESLIEKMWDTLHVSKLITHLTSEEYETQPHNLSLITLARVVGAMSLRVPNLAGADSICAVGPSILRDAFDAGVEYVVLTQLCPDAFRETYCGTKGPKHENWFPNKLTPMMNWPMLIDVVVKSHAQQNHRTCSFEIKQAVALAFASEVFARNAPMDQSRDEAIEIFSVKYLDLCPLLYIPNRYQSRAWYLFHLCDYNENLVCTFTDSWSGPEETYLGLRLQFGISKKNSIKKFIQATNFIHLVNSLKCKESFLQLFDRILQAISATDIIELSKSLEPELGSEIQSICSHATRYHRYVKVFCDEARVQDIVDDPVKWTELWKKYGFENDCLCAYSRRFELDYQSLRLEDQSADVGEFLVKDLAFAVLIAKRSVTCEGEDENLVAEHIAKLVSHAVLVNSDRIRPTSDWDRLSSVAEPLCEEFSAVIFGRESIYASRLCPNHLTFTSLEGMRRRLKEIPITTFCEWLNPVGGGLDSVMHRYCSDGCYDLAETYDWVPNPNVLDWMQRWVECGSPEDLIRVFRTVGLNWRSYDIVEQIESDRFDNFLQSLLKSWNTFPDTIIAEPWFMDLIAILLGRGFKHFVGSISELSLDHIESFCMENESLLVGYQRRFNLMCENLPLSIDDFSSALYWEKKESFCLNYTPRTEQRKQLKLQMCDLKCYRLATVELLNDLTKWIPLWRQCDSPTDILCRVRRKFRGLPSNFAEFIDKALFNWAPIATSECSDDLIANIAHIVSSQLDWRTSIVTESQRSVIHEFCIKEHDYLNSIVPTMKKETVFLAAECDNLPISFDTFSFMSSHLEIPPSTICNQCASDKRTDSIAEFCSDPNCYQLALINDPVAWTEVWLKCHAPTDPVCGFLDRTASTHLSIDSAVKVALDQQLPDIETLKNRFSLPRMINSIDRLPQCAPAIRSYIGAVLGFGLERLSRLNGLSLSDIDHEESFGDISNLCHHHGDMVVNLFRRFPALLFICPDLPVSLKTLESILAPAIPSSLENHKAFGNIVVSRDRAFSDWLAQIGAHPTRFFPTKVFWKDEPGDDIGGISRDWITKMADIVSSPATCDPAGGLFELDPISQQYLVFSRTKTAAGEGALSVRVSNEYYHFGRFLAVVLIKQEQIGIPLPVMFFAKLLNAKIRPAHLQAIDSERANMFSKLIKDVENSGYSEEDFLEIEFPELAGVELKLTKDNVKEQVSTVLDAIYMPGRANQAMNEIRKGFSEGISIKSMRNKITPALFRHFVVGDETLDVDELQRLADRNAETFHAPQISDRVFQMLFDWLSDNPQFHRQFMIFTTGSASLRPRELCITGPDSPKQGLVPKAHTCFSWLALPAYKDYDELDRMLSEAIFHTQMGMM